MAATTQMFFPSSFDFTFTYYPENTYYTSGVSTPPSLNALFDVEDIPPSLSVASVALLYPDILPADPLLTSSGAQDSLDNNESDEVSPTSTEPDNDNHHGPQSGAPPPPDFLEFPLPILNATPDELPYPPSALYPPLPEDEGAEQSITDLSVHDDYSTEFTTPPPAKRRRLDSHNQSTQGTHDFTDPVPSSWVLEENGTYWTKPGGYVCALDANKKVATVHPQCRKFCKYKGDLDRHLLARYHREPSFICTGNPCGCGRKFTRPDPLKRHIIRQVEANCSRTKASKTKAPRVSGKRSRSKKGTRSQ